MYGSPFTTEEKNRVFLVVAQDDEHYRKSWQTGKRRKQDQPGKMFPDTFRVRLLDEQGHTTELPGTATADAVNEIGSHWVSSFTYTNTHICM